MARTEGLNLLSFEPQKSLRKEPIQIRSRAFAVKAIPPPVKPACQSPGKTIPYQSLHQFITVPSPVPHHSQVPVPSPVPSGAARKTRSLKPTSRAPNSTETALEEVIRRPMLLSPQLREIWIVTRAFPSELVLRLSTFRVGRSLPNHSAAEEHWTKEGEFSLEALYKMSEGFFFGPHHLIMAALLYFEEKVTKRSFRERLHSHSSFQGCYGQILEHWIPLSLSWREAICREPLLLINGKYDGLTKLISLGSLNQLQGELPKTHTEDSHSFSEQSCSRDGSHQSMPRADVSHSGSTTAILRQLQAHFDLPPAVSPPLYPAEPHSHLQVSSSRAPSPTEAPLKRQIPSA
ncbi:hypothetical protein CK203_093876 [Vitis vinifera]|uniref:Uncharacterized protein n=1 Tax=Vitis vinifera TaxID=29760 RepID=A0A438C7E3_VITVI|nr:hypothetical protein CK203_093876 [Vitis vinifera]